PAAAIPSHVAALAAGVTRAMSTNTLKVAVGLLLAVSLIAGTGALARHALAANEPPADNHKSEAGSGHGTSPAADDKGAMAYAGRVLGPAGQPVAGAKLYLTLALGNLKRPSPSPEYAATGPDGCFRFTVPKAGFGGLTTVVTASTANHGAGWVQVPADGKR